MENEEKQNKKPLKSDEALAMALELGSVRGFLDLFYTYIQQDGIDCANLDSDDLCTLIMEKTFQLKTAIDRLKEVD